MGVNHLPVVAFIDMCPIGELPAYLDFLQAHLYDGSDKSFALAPMGIAPFEMEMDGFKFFFVWQIVIGEFHAFRAAKNQLLGEVALPTVALIDV